MIDKQIGESENCQMLAFVHIEKAAGTTLIHILRRNYFLRYCDVRPMKPESNREFQAPDLRTMLHLNPLVRCIAGHALKPYIDLSAVCPDIKYITLLRDPVKRYISQFQYLTQKMAHSFTFQEFLDDPEYDNFQTKKIAGSEDVEEAKMIFAKRFLLVGVVEQFDEYLIMLKRKLAPMKFDPNYRQLNVARDKQFGQDILAKYREQILDKNKADILLYDYVVNEIVFNNRIEYGDGLKNDLEEFRSQSDPGIADRLKASIDYVFRKTYLEPLSGIIRKVNGLPAKGSY